jgi:hypothetical protein
MPPPNLLYIFIKLSPAVRIKQREKKVTSEAVFGQRDTYKTGKWFVHALNRWMPVRKFSPPALCTGSDALYLQRPMSAPEHSWFIGPKTGSGHRGAFIASPPEAGAWPNSPKEADRASRCGRFSLAAIRRASMRQAPINGTFPVLTSPIFKTIIWMATGGDHDCR